METEEHLLLADYIDNNQLFFRSEFIKGFNQTEICSNEFIYSAGLLILSIISNEDLESSLKRAKTTFISKIIENLDYSEF